MAEVKKSWWQSWNSAGEKYELHDLLEEAEQCYINANNAANLARVRKKLAARGGASGAAESSSSPIAEDDSAGPAAGQGEPLTAYVPEEVAPYFEKKGFEATIKKGVLRLKKSSEFGMNIHVIEDSITDKPSYLAIRSVFDIEPALADDVLTRGKMMDVINYNCKSLHVFVDSDGDVVVTSALPLKAGFSLALLNELVQRRRAEMNKIGSSLLKLVK